MKLLPAEGNRLRLDGGAMFGNVPRALWSKWLEPDGRNRIEMTTRGLFIPDLSGKSVLFETGIGMFFPPELRDRFGVLEDEHMLLRSLEAIGTSHENIDVVVLSHMHFDHAGGLLAAYEDGAKSRLLFPNATFLVGADAWTRACNPHPRDRASFIPELQGMLEATGRLHIVSGESSPVLGDDVHFHFSDGHTPGLMMSQIGGTGGVLFCSDLMPARPWVHLPVTMGYDRYPEALIDEKRQILKMVIEQDLRLFFTHDPDCALASVQRDESGRYSATTIQSPVL